MALTVALLGTGPVAEHHLAAFVESPLISAVVLAEPDKGARDDAVKRWGIIKQASGDFKQAIRSADVALVDICAAPELHRELAVQALRANRDTIVAGPLATSDAECQEVLGAAKSSGKRLFVELEYLFAPHQTEARKLISSGRFAKPSLASCSVRGPSRLSVLQGHLHRVAYCLDDLLGKIISVSCHQVGVGAGGAAAVNLEFAGGGLGAVLCAVRASDPHYECRLSGEEGFMLLRDNPEDEAPLIVGSEGMAMPARVPCPLDFAQWAHRNAMLHLIRCVASGEKPLTTLQQARSAVRVVEAARQSAATGQRIRLGSS